VQTETPSPNQREADITKAFMAKAKRRDRLARGVIMLGGIGIIAAVTGIFVLIVGVALPLFHKASVVKVPGDFRLSDPGSILAAGLDDYSETVFVVRRQGEVEGFSPKGKALWKEPLRKDAGTNTIAHLETTGINRFSLVWSDGQASLVEVSFKSAFDDKGIRSIQHQILNLGSMPAGAVRPDRTLMVVTDQGVVRADLLPDRTLRVLKQVEKTDFLGNRTTKTEEGIIKPELIGLITDYLVDRTGNHLYASTDRGELAHWSIRNPAAAERLDLQTTPDAVAVRDLTFVFGEVSLAVADGNGEISTWSSVRRSPDAPMKQLTLIHPLRGHSGGVARLIPSTRSKSIFSVGADGAVHADHMTSERALWSIPSPNAPLLGFAINSRDNAAFLVAADGAASLWSIDCPHPEISLKTLLGKVWYEGADEPAHVWQSSAGNDDYEPKLGLTPLISGTLKGTFYSLLLAAPIGILGALYVSQFMNPRWRRTIKPAVEIMAAIPSVVLGFLAGLWLAPLLENRLPGVFMMVPVIPLVVFLGILILQRMRRLPGLRTLDHGLEFVAMMPLILLGVMVAMGLGAWAESSWLGGDFRQWVFQTFDIRIDQRNAVIIAFALGFTVTPVIFTLADDALSSVPRNLTAASLALGASRWQTAWRVVMPSASPGIFAAVMIGIGRAVGETMIVLMATGNTPILDWGPFNGMRTLSANIAVEIPEAPHHSTLYRTLFLSGCVLFAFTFTLNTIAELIRIRLRKKYGNY
jgi:phosphate transport system permease protein